MVAGGRLGQRGNDHRNAASDGQAPRRGASRSADVLPLRPRLCRDQSGTPAGVHNISCAVTRRSPPRNPPATSGYRLATLRVDRSNQGLGVSALQRFGVWPQGLAGAAGAAWGVLSSSAWTAYFCCQFNWAFVARSRSSASALS